LLRIGYIRPRLFDGRRPAFHVGSELETFAWQRKRRHQRIDFPLLVSDLPFEGGLFRRALSSAY